MSTWGSKHSTHLSKSTGTESYRIQICTIKYSTIKQDHDTWHLTPTVNRHNIFDEDWYLVFQPVQREHHPLCNPQTNTGSYVQCKNTQWHRLSYLYYKSIFCKLIEWLTSVQRDKGLVQGGLQDRSASGLVTARHPPVVQKGQRLNLKSSPRKTKVKWSTQRLHIFT